MQCNGAFVVPYEESMFCVLPDGKEIEGLEGIENVREEEVWEKIAEGLKRLDEEQAQSQAQQQAEAPEAEVEEDEVHRAKRARRVTVH